MRCGVFLTAVSLIAGCGAPAEPMRAKPDAPLPDRIPLDNRREASQALQRLFESKGLSGLTDLAKHADTAIALHAAWEQSKRGQIDTATFIEVFKKKLHIEPPRWWQNCLKGIKVYEGNCHYVPNVDSSNFGAKCRLTLERYDIQALAEPAHHGGFPYNVRVMDRKRNEPLWTGEVWSVGRIGLGGHGVHQIELVVADERLYVFGAESHGMYAEVFRLENGEPLARFCTCYWFNPSERWNLK